MDASARIEELALEVIARGKVDRRSVLQLIATVEATSPTADRNALQRLLKASMQKPQDPQIIAGILNDLSRSLALKPETKAAPAADGLLRYDIDQPRDVVDGFLAEVTGHVESIEGQLLYLETRAHDTDALNSVFGSMHSLKGIMGFMSVTEGHGLAHEAEALMDRARKRADGITHAECDAVLKSVDGFREILTAIRQHCQNTAAPFPPLPAAAVIALDSLRSALNGSRQEAALPQQATPDSGSKTTRIERNGFVRVKVDKLDTLLDAIGEMVVTQTQVQQDPSWRGVNSPRLQQNLSQLNKITRDMQAIAMSLRMHPVREMFSRMTRLVRDLAHKYGKLIDVSVSGEETEMDKNVMEALVDPLTHLCRNAVDHGVDSAEVRQAAGKPARATISFAARHQGSNVIIEVRDDGSGLDHDRILSKARTVGLVGAETVLSEAQVGNLVFEPGFSTKDTVTELSGRGVGLDVVRRNVQALSGRVSVASERGKYTAFTLTIPLTLAIAEALVVRIARERYVIPITSVVELLRPARHQVSTVCEQGEMIDVRGTHLRLVRLSNFVGMESEITDPTAAIVLIIEVGGERCGLMVDELLGQQQVVIKTLGESLRRARGITGGAVLGDGCVGLILDIAEILAVSRRKEEVSSVQA